MLNFFLNRLPVLTLERDEVADMTESNAHTRDVERRRDVLRGPPGVLFGLTLLIFAAAGAWFGWGPTSPPLEDHQKIATSSTVLE
jgi:hypothetical protein